MRLLDTATGQFVEVNDSGAVEYAILSHTWDPKGEQSYQELKRIQDAYRPESEVPNPPLSSQSSVSTPSPSLSSHHEHIPEPVVYHAPPPVGEKYAEPNPSGSSPRKGSLLVRKYRSVLRPILRLATKITAISRRSGAGGSRSPDPAHEPHAWTSGRIFASPEPSTIQVQPPSIPPFEDGERVRTRARTADSPYEHWAPRYHATPITPPSNPLVMVPYPIFDSPAASPTTPTPTSRTNYPRPLRTAGDRYPTMPSQRQATTHRTPLTSTRYSTYPAPQTLAQYPIRPDRSMNPPPQVPTRAQTPPRAPSQRSVPNSTTNHKRIYGVPPRLAPERESPRTPTPLPKMSRSTSKSTRRHHVTGSAPPELPTPPATPPRANKFWDDTRISAKIRRACSIARAHGHRLIWIDICCIDRTSSAELSEAVNSMFRWYRDASVCYVYLSDVPSTGGRSAEGEWEEEEEEAQKDDEDVQGTEDPHNPRSAFRQSRWFRRGWTLQELIAPRVVVFLSLDWHFLGTKASLSRVIEDVTGIDRPVLLHRMRLDEVSVARRMSWAAERRTTRVEDEAYSLLGIFDVNMPALYGEGHRAFIRLQEEIMKRIPDQSLFTWGSARYLPTTALDARRTPDSAKISESYRICFESSPVLDTTGTLFADSPQQFGDAWSIRSLSHEQFVRRLGLPSGMDSPSRIVPWRHSITPYGVRTQIPLVPVTKVIPHHALAPAPNSALDKSYSDMYFALLACEPTTRAGHVMAVVCTVERAHTGTGLTIATGGTWSVLNAAKAERPFRVTALSPELLRRCRAHLSAEMLYIPLEDPQHLRVARPIWRQTDIRVAGWSTAILRELGYAVEGGRMRSRSYRFTLAKGDDAVVVEFEYGDASEWSTEISVAVTPQPSRARSRSMSDSGHASIRRRSPRFGAHSPEPVNLHSPSQRFQLAEYNDARECRLRLSSGLYLTLVFVVQRISSVLGYLDVQVLGQGSRESTYTLTGTHASRASASMSVSAVASARMGLDELVEQDEPSEVPEMDLEAEEEMPSPAVSASSFRFLDEAEGRVSVTRSV